MGIVSATKLVSCCRRFCCCPRLLVRICLIFRVSLSSPPLSLLSLSLCLSVFRYVVAFCQAVEKAVEKRKRGESSKKIQREDLTKLQANVGEWAHERLQRLQPTCLQELGHTLTLLQLHTQALWNPTKKLQLTFLLFNASFQFNTRNIEDETPQRRDSVRNATRP